MGRKPVSIRMRNPKKTANKSILVTGATSGIGSALVELLLHEGYEVRALIRDNPKNSRDWMSLPGGAKIYVADIRLNDEKNIETMREACRGVDVLFHLAASTRNARHDYNELINTNVIGTENLLKAYFDANPDANFRLRFIYASSVTVYGYHRRGEVLTEESEAQPETAYSESKYMAEQVIKAFGSANRRLSYTILRIGILYGKEYTHNFMHIFKLLNENKMRYIGNAENHLPLVNVADVLDVFLALIDNKKSENKVYNLTDGVPYTQRELLKKAAKMINADPPSKAVHPFVARVVARTRGIDTDQFHFLISDRTISIERIKRELGFRPRVSIDEGGRLIAEEFLNKHKMIAHENRKN